MTSTTKDVAQRRAGTADLVKSYGPKFAALLPEHVRPEKWLTAAIGVLRDDRLREAAESDPQSLVSALLRSANLGLDPGTEQYYLRPVKIKGLNQVQGIVGYQGLVELMYRAGAVSSVVVEVVRANDDFRYTPGLDPRPVHVIDWDSEDRGELRLAYAYAVMKDGATSKVVVLNRRHIDTLKAKSDGATSQYSPWVNFEESMWLKSAARQLAKWVPTSSEYRREQLRAERDVAAETPKPRAIAAVEDPGGSSTVDVVTGELLDDEEDWARAVTAE